MRQKFILQNDDAKNELSIKEYASLTREQKNNPLTSTPIPFSLIGEESYDKALILSAIGKGKDDLVCALRTRNMYPIIMYAEKIADSVMEIYNKKNNLSVELEFNDKEFLNIEMSEAAS